jgi:hypothetical protein
MVLRRRRRRKSERREPVASVADLPAALGRIVEATTAGEISPGEAGALCGMLGAVRQSLQVAELAERMEEIERRLSSI